MQFTSPLSRAFRAGCFSLAVLLIPAVGLAQNEPPANPGLTPTEATPADKIVNPELHSLTALIEGKGFVRIRPGQFTMGSPDGNPDEQPPHTVRITHEFEMGRFEVTQAQWDAAMRNPHAKPDAKDSPEKVNPSHFKGPANPVENVSWDSVQEFLRALNSRDPKHVYRLPTEAEWEYAARAGKRAEASNKLTDEAWFAANSGGRPHAVGLRQANAWGLHDMIGNVMEWVADWYVPSYYGGSPDADPVGPASSSYKVYRGCAWLSEPKQCRPGYRGFDFPTSGYYSVGFRLVRTPK